ncbi:MAG: YiiX/YebB-like N1pC/P60 family cysteine hydrolase [Flavobacteriales bacterium]
MKYIITAFISLTILSACNTGTTTGNSLKKSQSTEQTDGYKAGDIVFQQGSSAQCVAVKAATGSEWSHCGIILPHSGKLMVLEAIQPVQWEEIGAWKKRGDGNVMEVKRLIADSLLTDDVVQRMVNYGSHFVGEDYDIFFNWDDTEWYCSELVWKIYYNALRIEVGVRKPLKEYNLNEPIVKQIMDARYGSKPPLDMMMISPVAIYESDLLTDVVAAERVKF